MRRPVRGHSVVFMTVDVKLPKKTGGVILYSLRAYCSICRTSWDENISPGTRRRLAGPDPRRAMAEVVALAVSRTPSCEEAYRKLVAREVMET